MLSLEFLELVFEVLNMLLLAFTEGALRGSVLCPATLMEGQLGASGVNGVWRHLQCACWRRSLYLVVYLIAFSVGLPFEAG